MSVNQNNSSTFDRGSFDQFSTMLLSHRALVASLSLFNGWVFAMGWSGVFSAPDAVLLGALTVNGFWLLSLGVCTLVLAVFFLVPALRNWANSTTIAVAALCMTASAVITAVAAAGADPASPLYFAGALLSGAGTGIMTMLWGHLIPRFDPSVVLGFIAVALFATALIILGISLLPNGLAVFLMMVVPLGSWAALAPSVNHSRFGEQKAGSAPTAFAAKVVPDRDTGKVTVQTNARAKISSLVLVFMVLVAVMGLSAGLLRSLVYTEPQPDSAALVFAIATACAALMLLISKVPDRGSSFSAFYRAIAFIAVAFIILAFAAPQSPDWAAFTLAIHAVGFIYFYGLLWVFCAIFTQRDGDESRVFIGGMLTNQLGQLGGFFAGAGLTALFGFQAILSPASNAMVYLIMFAVIIFLARLSNDAKSRPAMSSEASMEKACELATVRFGLTPRESEILSYLIRGYDRSYIARSLTVSPETVKTHTQHIYAKMDAHTRLEVFNAAARCLEEEA